MVINMTSEINIDNDLLNVALTARYRTSFLLAKR